MDSDEENLYDDVDSGNESSGDDVDFAMEDDQGNAHKERPCEVEDYPYEVLSTEEIVQHMVDCIKDVNTVVEVRAQAQNEIFVQLISSQGIAKGNLIQQGPWEFFNNSRFLMCLSDFQIPATITRILLNHFKWDKEKLMEKYYDSQDQDQLFSEARVVSPFRKIGTAKVVKVFLKIY